MPDCLLAVALKILCFVEHLTRQMLVKPHYHSTADCDHADMDNLTLNAKKLYLMISVMLHASKRDIKFS